MYRQPLLRSIASGLATALIISAFSSGCGGGDSGSQAPLSEEGKKADANIQDGMKAFMQSKTQSRSKAVR